MDYLAEKRVFAASEGATALVVASAPGLVVVSVAEGRVGEFGLARRGNPADVAVADGRFAVATDEDVLLAHAPDVDALEPTGFGPARAVTFDGGRPVALSPDGRVGVHDAAGWVDRGRVPAAPAAIDGELIATVDGVYRLLDDDFVAAGLAVVNDVAHVGGVPLAATGNGLYELGNGWLEILAGDVRVVAGAADGRAHASTVDGLFARAPDGSWDRVETPTDHRVVALAHGDRTYAATAAGDLLVEGEDEWRVEPLGLAEPAALAVL